MNFKLTLLLALSINSLGFAFTPNDLLRPQQDTLQLKPSYKANQLLLENKSEELLVFCKEEISRLLKQSIHDSLEIAELYKYQNKAHYSLGDYLESIKSAEKGLKFCNNTEAGRLLKGQLYSDKASAQNYTGQDRGVFNSTLNAIEYLTSIKKPNYDYLITSYRFLSEQCAYHGNFDDAKQYLRQAEELYKNNKKEVDQAVTRPDGYRYKYDLILLYSKVYQLYKYGKTKQDSLDVIKSLKRLEQFHKISDFHKEHDGVYYTTTLNHIGDWYASRKPESKITKQDLESALHYLNKSIDLVKNKGYTGNLSTFKYNKVKALTLSNNLVEAEVLISELINALENNDGRKPFFLAQKGLIKAKQKQKNSAIAIFQQALQKVHSDSIKLNKDFKNFKPSLTFGHTKLLLRISEELQKYFPEDEAIKKLVSRLYAMAFMQFENSYDKRKFNKTQKTYLRQIVQGVLRSKKLGYNKDIKVIDVLNRFENIQNLLAWQKFNQNAQVINFPELDSLQLRNYDLRRLVAEAKSNNVISVEDSLQTLLSQTEKFTKETYPNLNLFNEQNFKVEALQKKLQPDQLVLKYTVFKNELAIYKITKNNVEYSLKPWSDKEVDVVNSFILNLQQKQFSNNDAKILRQLLLPEVNKDIKHLIINPDDVLSKLAYEVLPINNQLLIEKCQISYTSNLGFIFPNIYRKPQETNLAIYAPEYPQSEVELAVRSKPVFLEGAQKEATLISKLFPSNLYNGRDLTKQNFIETAAKHKVLHLAMHATVDNQQAGISRLLFSKENSKEDDLYLEELYALNLNADLAVLSACNTGIDNSNSGTDIESFQRAFTFAGVPSTVASLWEVPDLATQEIMVSFYSNLKKGLSKSQALKEAKLEYQKNYAGTKFAQPFYWAGFVIYGEDASIAISSTSYWIYILGFLVVIGLVALYRKKLNGSRV